MVKSRTATHAGSWYSSSKSQLSSQLDSFLKNVESPASGICDISSTEEPATLPPPQARAIIAPHAGYSYSGPAAAWAYKSLDLSNAKRVFLLGPSHHFWLAGCALSKFDTYSTPLGDLKLDKETIAELHQTGAFDEMSSSVDEDEHSLEMHLPYIYKILSLHFSNPADFPLLTPILVGGTSPSAERRYGKILAPYLADPTSVFVISSDFAHWGSRFRYTYYEPASGSPQNLSSSAKTPRDPPIHESIKAVDFRCMNAIETGKYDNFQQVLQDTKNTVCGRHPIGVVMAAVEAMEEGDKGQFRFIRYERSSLVENIRDSSVSYASAYAIF